MGTAERQRVFRKIQENAAHRTGEDRDVWEHLAAEFANPQQLLGGEDEASH